MTTVHKNDTHLKLNYALFAGKNGDYYEHKWEKMSATNQKVSFNFAAFFFSILWLGYRKMYAITALFATGFLVLNTILYIIILRYGIGVNTHFIFETLLVLTAIFVGLFGNALYKHHAKRHFTKAIHLANEQNSLDNLLKAKGGSNLLGPVLSGFIFILLISFPLDKLDEEVRMKDTVKNHSEEINLVKSVVLDGEYFEVEDFTLGEMYQGAFEKGQWRDLESKKPKKVEFSGTIEVYDQPTDVTILFNIIAEDDVRIESVRADGNMLEDDEANLLLDLVRLEYVKTVQK